MGTECKFTFHALNTHNLPFHQCANVKRGIHAITRGRSKNCPCHAITLVAQHCLMSRVQFKLATLCMSKLPSVVPQPCMMYWGAFQNVNVMSCEWTKCPVPGSCPSILHGVLNAIQAGNCYAHEPTALSVVSQPCMVSRLHFRPSILCTWANRPVSCLSTLTDLLRRSSSCQCDVIGQNCPDSCPSTLHDAESAIQASNVMQMSKLPCQLSLISVSWFSCKSDCQC